MHAQDLGRGPENLLGRMVHVGFSPLPPGLSDSWSLSAGERCQQCSAAFRLCLGGVVGRRAGSQPRCGKKPAYLRFSKDSILT